MRGSTLAPYRLRRLTVSVPRHSAWAMMGHPFGVEFGMQNPDSVKKRIETGESVNANGDANGDASGLRVGISQSFTVRVAAIVDRNDLERGCPVIALRASQGSNDVKMCPFEPVRSERRCEALRSHSTGSGDGRSMFPGILPGL